MTIVQDESQERSTGPLETELSEPRKGFNWGVVLVWVLVLGLLVIVGLGLVRTQEGPIGIGKSVPDFTLTTFDGQQYSIEDYRGKVVLVNFWASWCKPCEQEAVELEQAYQNFKNREVVFLGVDYVDTETEALAYLDRFNITYPNGPDLGTRISQAFRIRGVPETYIVGRDGKIVGIKISPYLSLEEIETALLQALAQ
jgi:cytochrome c biogenesis protein CcmG/thiol:disulfide interchange protein DsbE